MNFLVALPILAKTVSNSIESLEKESCPGPLSAKKSFLQALKPKQIKIAIVRFLIVIEMQI